MRSDENKTPRLEIFEEDMGKGIRLFAYSHAISGKAGRVSSSPEDKTKALMKEPNYRLDTCDKA